MRVVPRAYKKIQPAPNSNCSGRAFCLAKRYQIAGDPAANTTLITHKGAHYENQQAVRSHLDF